MYSREDGNLAELVLRPALSRSVAYDRSAGYFSAKTLVMAADGIEDLCRNGGTIRLVVGSIASEAEAEAIERGEKDAARVAEERCRGMLEVPEGYARDALELLAWLVGQRRLEIRLAVPRRAEDGLLDLGHIFHQKTAIFKDAAGQRIGFNGSVNETPAGWAYNWESLMLFRSWDYSREGLDELVANFERLWKGEMQTAYVVDIPKALQDDLMRYAPPDDELPARLRMVQETSPVSPHAVPSLSWREVRNFLSDTPALPSALAVGAATSAVQPWPHQWRAFRRMYEPWRKEGRPPRLLIADEVGLGKTIEAGMLLRQAIMAGLAQHVLVLVPASIQRQWQRELREKFLLEWPIYDGEQFVYPAKVSGERDRTRAVTGDWTREPFVIASSHLMRRMDRRASLVEAEPWDLLIVDEAHHGRREAAGTLNEGGPNRLLSLLQELQRRDALRGLILLTATPLQTALVELFDLLALLGLPEPWSNRHAFERFFERLRRDVLSKDDIAALAGYVRSCTAAFPEGKELFEQALRSAGASGIARRKIEEVISSGSSLDADRLRPDQRELFREVARRTTPVAALVSRHTRPLLRQYGIRIAHREPVDLFVERSDEEVEIAESVERFIRDEFKRAEQIADGRKRGAIGFVLTTYGKRLASSLEALRLTLERHLSRVEDRFGREVALSEDAADDDADGGVTARPDDAEDARKLEVEALAQIETSRIREIFERVQRFYGHAEDKKLLVLREALERLREMMYDQAIIFTQYTDTLDWLRERLPGYRILCYSGRGGEYRGEDGGWKPLSRDDTRRRFAAGDADLLLCTDAAAEGLNLQTCGALVNFDLPWNPMRVEQRIGRIDRIGQARDVVRIVNLYYPGTVETLVYRRLQDRIALFGDVVGRLQPILARVATLIEADVLGAAGEPILQELDRGIERLEGEALDLDAAVLEDLEDAVAVPQPPYDLEQLGLLLEHPERLPVGYSARSLGLSQWAVAKERGGVEARVTSDRRVYESNVEDYELWSPRSSVFPRLDAPRPDVRADEYAPTLEDMLIG